MSIIFKNRNTLETWISENEREYLCLSANGDILLWKLDYGNNWYFEDVSSEWMVVCNHEE